MFASKIAIVLGTRPEIIKMASVIRECQRRQLNFFIIHTNQHYSREMDAVFFKELDLPPADYDLQVGSGVHGLQTGKMLARIEKAIIKEKAQIVLVHGDTNTTLSGALAARKLNLKVGHVEAGLRSFDQTMPEEVNRVLTDHMTNFCFTPTPQARDNLLKEGILKEKIFVVGNTIVDAVSQHQKIAQRKSRILTRLKLKPHQYFLVTYHRAENTDNKEKLANTLTALDQIAQKNSWPVIFSLHPRTKKQIEKFKLKIPKTIRAYVPFGYLDFLQLMAKAKLILTDSGGIQEESCMLKVPCLTLRENTERPETLKVGGNLLVGTDPQKILSSAQKILKRQIKWYNPFGDGQSAQKIIDILTT